MLFNIQGCYVVTSHIPRELRDVHLLVCLGYGDPKE